MGTWLAHAEGLPALEGGKCQRHLAIDQKAGSERAWFQVSQLGVICFSIMRDTLRPRHVHTLQVPAFLCEIGRRLHDHHLSSPLCTCALIAVAQSQ